MNLSSLIADRIRKEGPIPFRDFMESALYYPDLGYYMSLACPVGPDGDYYTSPYLTPAVGYAIGKQFEQMWTLMDKPRFTVVEYGAGPGILTKDILECLKENADMYRNLRYCIIEKSPSMRERERALLHSRVVEWPDSVEQIGPFCGCVFSNELLDNFAVHQVLMEHRLMEVWVGCDGKDAFHEILRPAGDALTGYLSDLGANLTSGFRTEVNLEVERWLGEVTKYLSRGFLLTIDYGYTSSQQFNQKRSCGTMLCYHRHDLSDNPYERVGMQDITTHVNFSALDRWGTRAGLTCSGLIPQVCFLLAMGLGDFLEKARRIGEFAIRQEAEIKRALLVSMGTRFKVMIQQKALGSRKLPLFRQPQVVRNLLSLD